MNEEVPVIYSLARQLRFNNTDKPTTIQPLWRHQTQLCVCASFNSVLLSGRCLVLRPLFTPWAQLVLTTCSSSYSHDGVLLLGDVLHLEPRAQRRLCLNLRTSSPTEPGTHREQGALRSILSYTSKDRSYNNNKAVRLWRCNSAYARVRLSSYPGTQCLGTRRRHCRVTCNVLGQGSLG